MTDTPYPGASEGAPHPEPRISYSLREVIDQINGKLDLLPQLVSDQAAMRADQNKLEARVLVVETRLEDVASHEDQAVGAALFRDRFFTKLIALAGVMGVVAGLTVQIVQAFA